MPHYLYDKCPVEKLDDIRELADRLGMRETEENREITWAVSALDTLDETINKDGVIVIKYLPQRTPTRPLFVQTTERTNYKNPETARVLKEIADICETTKVYTLAGTNIYKKLSNII